MSYLCLYSVCYLCDFINVIVDSSSNSTANVIWRLEHGLKSQSKNIRSPGWNLGLARQVA